MKEEVKKDESISKEELDKYMEEMQAKIKMIENFYKSDTSS